MPISASFTSTQSYQIPDQVYTMRVRMWGGGGGGEYISPNLLSSTDGGNGGDSSWLGLVAGGGQGGGRSSGRNSLGSGGSFNTNSYAGVSASSGNNGGFPTGGAAISYGGTSYGAGGGGSPGFFQYVSTSTHFFDNVNNVNTFTSTSSDITASYENPGAPDGLFGTTPSNGKYYRINFNVPYIDNTWTFSVGDICQQAAAGGTAGAPYSFNGSRDKNSNGISLWFQTKTGANTYIRCFTFISVGRKQGAQGRGGGSGAALEVTLSRNQIIEKGYTPGASYTAQVGAGGGGGGSDTGSGTAGRIDLLMYIIPTVNLSSTKTAVIRGGCAQLAWSTTGDASQITWTSGPLTNTNLSSNATVCPTETTTYTAVASGLGGSSAPASVTIIVYEPPTASLSSPSSLNYGQQGFISFQTQYADVSIVITPYYTYRDNNTGNNFTSVGTPVSISPAGSASLGGSNSIVSNPSLQTNIPYNESGPFSVQYIIVAQGTGGEATATSTTQIIVDTMPENLMVPETDGRFKSENPVFTPQTEILSELLLVDGVDIPVEIKANAPIQVDINKQNNWKDLRSL